MIGPLLIGAVAWLTAFLLLAAAIQWSARGHSILPQPSTSALARSLTPPAPAGDNGWNGQRSAWTVTRATSGQRALMVDVRAVRIEDAETIAAWIVAPKRHEYDEILVYVRAVGGKAATTRRIQWTRLGGYGAMLVIEPGLVPGG